MSYRIWWSFIPVLLESLTLGEINTFLNKNGINLTLNSNTELGWTVQTLGIDEFVTKLKVKEILNLFLSEMSNDVEESFKFDIFYYFRNISTKVFPKFFQDLRKTGVTQVKISKNSQLNAIHGAWVSKIFLLNYF